MQRGKGSPLAIGAFLLIFPTEIWHCPDFRDEETTERKERWIKLLIENGDDKVLNAAAYLFVIQSLESYSGTCNVSAQKFEEWITALK